MKSLLRPCRYVLLPDVDPSSDSAGDTGSGMGSSSFLMCVSLCDLYVCYVLLPDVDPSSDSAGDTGSGMGSSSFLMCVFESQPASKGKLTDIGVVVRLGLVMGITHIIDTVRIFRFGVWLNSST